MSELLVLSGEQSSFERGEEGADGPLLQAIRVQGGVGKPGKRKVTFHTFYLFSSPDIWMR